MINGFPTNAFYRAIADREARERDETNAEIATARGAIEKCIAAVKVQAKGSAADFSEVIARLEETLGEMPELVS